MLTGRFRAWVSTATDAARAVVRTAAGPFIRTDGVVVADSTAELLSGVLKAPIDRDESGRVRRIDTWTGTLTSGQPAALHCAGFTTSSQQISGLCGASFFADGRWTDNLQPDCSVALGLYCFQQSESAPAQ